MAKKLTSKFVENVKPLPERKEYPDGGTGLYLVVQSTGVKSFAGRYRHLATPKKLTLGRWPRLALAAARKDWATALHELAQGHDPAAAREGAKLKAAEAKRDTVANICAEYMRREGCKLRTSDARESILRRLVYPVVGDRPITEVKRSEIVRLLDRVEDHNGPRMADVCLATLRRIFHWHEKRTDEFRSPIIRGMARQKVAEHRRTRVLDDDEIRKLWASTADGSPFSTLTRFLLLSAARRGETAGMKWSEIDAGGLWTLPASRSKTGAEIVRPLSAGALALLAELPRIEGCPFVFISATGHTPISQFSMPKTRLEAASGVTGWRLHDLRRTARSLLSRAGVNVDMAERCLGHALPAIRATYDRHQYIDEMRHAFETLAALIERIVNPPDAAVLAFRR
jgi:integrase